MPKPEPRIVLLGAIRAPSRTDYQYMRYFVGESLYAGAYVEVADATNATHHFVNWYDEFDVDLGWPTGPMTLLRSTGKGDNGIWVRFFDKGAVILNVSPAPQSVTAAELSKAKGYAGPYWRFCGGQAPGFNDGSKLTSVKLGGRKCGGSGLVGDAILLVRKPTTVVGDIVVDVAVEETSPGSGKATLTGSWKLECAGTSAAWVQGCRAYKKHWSLASTQAAAAQATFRPTIGAAGEYDLYEWHGSKAGATASSKVPLKVVHAKGTATHQVNQRVKTGRWNLLGRYSFAAGQAGHVTLGGGSPDGLVLADALMWVYHGP